MLQTSEYWFFTFILDDYVYCVIILIVLSSVSVLSCLHIDTI